jgi:NAD(P)-dependent dehydrogenase (short-subunit alcohol dehydrogenase family)
LAADVREAGQVAEACARLVRETGKIDALVHAAGVLGAIGPAQQVEAVAWRQDFETSTLGFYHSYRAAAPGLGRSPSPAVVALVGPGYHAELAHASAYSAGQAALVRLVETLAAEQSPDRMPIYAVFPGMVPTHLVRNLLDQPEGRRWLPRFTEAFAEGKETGPEFVAEMVHWLLDRRPAELSGRVISALQTPEILELRLAKVAEDDLGKLRIR